MLQTDWVSPDAIEIGPEQTLLLRIGVNHTLSLGIERRGALAKDCVPNI